jgi:hypothetical protein
VSDAPAVHRGLQATHLFEHEVDAGRDDQPVIGQLSTTGQAHLLARGIDGGDIALHDPAIEPWAAEQAAALGSGLANLGRLAALAGATLIVGGAWFLLRSRRIAAL